MSHVEDTRGGTFLTWVDTHPFTCVPQGEDVRLFHQRWSGQVSHRHVPQWTCVPQSLKLLLTGWYTLHHVCGPYECAHPCVPVYPCKGYQFVYSLTHGGHRHVPHCTCVPLKGILLAYPCLWWANWPPHPTPKGWGGQLAQPLFSFH